MIKHADSQPTYVAIQVNLSINVWLVCTGNEIPVDVKPDISEGISLGRTFAHHEKLDTGLAVSLNVDDMASRCAEALSSRIFNKL